MIQHVQAQELTTAAAAAAVTAYAYESAVKVFIESIKERGRVVFLVVVIVIVVIVVVVGGGRSTYLARVVYVVAG